MNDLLAVEPAVFVGTLNYVMYAVLVVCLVLLIAKRRSRKAKIQH